MPDNFHHLPQSVACNVLKPLGLNEPGPWFIKQYSRSTSFARIPHFLFFLKTGKREYTRVHAQRGRSSSRRPLSREPDTRLDLRTLGWWPQPKADAQWTEPSRRPYFTKSIPLILKGQVLKIEQGTKIGHSLYSNFTAAEKLPFCFQRWIPLH